MVRGLAVWNLLISLLLCQGVIVSGQCGRHWEGTERGGDRQAEKKSPGEPGLLTSCNEEDQNLLSYCTVTRPLRGAV